MSLKSSLKHLELLEFSSIKDKPGVLHHDNKQRCLDGEPVLRADLDPFRRRPGSLKCSESLGSQWYLVCAFSGRTTY